MTGPILMLSSLIQKGPDTKDLPHTRRALGKSDYSIILVHFKNTLFNCQWLSQYLSYHQEHQVDKNDREIEKLSGGESYGGSATGSIHCDPIIRKEKLSIHHRTSETQRLHNAVEFKGRCLVTIRGGQWTLAQRGDDNTMWFILQSNRAPPKFALGVRRICEPVYYNRRQGVKHNRILPRYI